MMRLLSGVKIGWEITIGDIYYKKGFNMSNSMTLPELHSLIIDGTRRLKVRKGDVSFLNLTGVGHIPVLVAKDNHREERYGPYKRFIIYVYNIILQDKDEPYTLNKEDLLMGPMIVLRNNWDKGMGFEYRYSLKPEDIDVFPNHCFAPGNGLFYDENGMLCQPFEPLAEDALNNITTISMEIIKKLKGIDVV